MGKFTLQIFEQKKDAEGNPKKDARGNFQLDAKFAESADTVYWAVKKLPTVGDIVEGEIIDGEYGPKFKRAWDDKKVQGAKLGARSQANTQRLQDQKSREDGQHQGMAINNAVQLLIRFAPEGTKVADLVGYIKPLAQAIYAIDLSPGKADVQSVQTSETANEQPPHPAETETAPPEEDTVPPADTDPPLSEKELESIEDIFGIPKN